MSDALKHFLGNVRDGDKMCIVQGDILLETEAYTDWSTAVWVKGFGEDDLLIGWADSGDLNLPFTQLQNRTAGINQGNYPAGSWVWDAGGIS